MKPPRSHRARTSLAIALDEPFNDVLGAAASAEELGYQGIWRPEGEHDDAFIICGAWAQTTKTVVIGTGIVSALTRTPIVLSRAAWTLSALSSGRFRLGLGAGEPGSPQSRVGVLERVREVVSVVRSGRAPGAIHASTTPIYLAALGPQMVELSASIADGVLLNWVTRAAVHAARRRLDHAALLAGRDPSHVRVAAYIRVGSGNEAETGREVFEQLRVFSKHRWYARHFSALGIDADHPGETDLRELAVWGSRQEVAEQLEGFRKAGADEVVVRPLGDGDRWWRAVEVAAPT